MYKKETIKEKEILHNIQVIQNRKRKYKNHFKRMVVVDIMDNNKSMNKTNSVVVVVLVVVIVVMVMVMVAVVVATSLGSSNSGGVG